MRLREHHEFLHTNGNEPSADFVAALLACCDSEISSAPIFVYNQSFEASRAKELAVRFPEKRRELLTLIERMVHLLPIVKAHYYHPSQQGSWSIKAVLPALVPELSYDSWMMCETVEPHSSLFLKLSPLTLRLIAELSEYSNYGSTANSTRSRWCECGKHCCAPSHEPAAD